MKTIKYIIAVFLLTSIAACEKIYEPELSTENTMSSIVCTVVKTEKMKSDGSKPEDEVATYQGVIASNGTITFSGLNELSEQQKKQAKFSAIIPITSTIVEKDGAGNIIGNGIGGIRTISKKTYYFYVIAANGAEKKYILAFN